LLLSALLLGGPPDAQAAGFLEELFGGFGGGGQDRAVQAPYSAPRRFERPRRREIRSSLDYLRGSPKQYPQKKYSRETSKRLHPDARKDAIDTVAGAGPVKKGFCYDQPPRGADPGEVEALLHDTTLRAGDTIATAEGLRVYSGGGGCPHQPGDFLALASSRYFKGAKRDALLAIENAMKMRLDSEQAPSILFSTRDKEAMSRQR
jgi:hypothetical protein